MDFLKKIFGAKSTEQRNLGGETQFWSNTEKYQHVDYKESMKGKIEFPNGALSVVLTPGIFPQCAHCGKDCTTLSNEQRHIEVFSKNSMDMPMLCRACKSIICQECVGENLSTCPKCNVSDGLDLVLPFAFCERCGKRAALVSGGIPKEASYLLLDAGAVLFSCPSCGSLNCAGCLHESNSKCKQCGTQKFELYIPGYDGTGVRFKSVDSGYISLHVPEMSPTRNGSYSTDEHKLATDGEKLTALMSQIIRETLDMLEPTVLKYGPMETQKVEAFMTPRHVQKTKGPRFWHERAEFKVDLNLGSRAWQKRQWMKGDSGDKAVYTHLFEGGLKFPDACPVTLDPPSHYEVIEVSIRRTGPQGKYGYTGIDSHEQMERLETALFCDRYWYVIPFSTNHGTYNRALHIDPLNSEVLFRNREYARCFGALNNLEDGKWLSTRHLGMSFVWSLGLVLSATVVFYSIVFYWVEGLSVIERIPGIVIIVISLMLFSLNLSLKKKAERGEPI